MVDQLLNSSSSLAEMCIFTYFVSASDIFMFFLQHLQLPTCAQRLVRNIYQNDYMLL